MPNNVASLIFNLVLKVSLTNYIFSTICNLILNIIYNCKLSNINKTNIINIANNYLYSNFNFLFYNITSISYNYINLITSLALKSNLLLVLLIRIKV